MKMGNTDENGKTNGYISESMEHWMNFKPIFGPSWRGFIKLCASYDKFETFIAGKQLTNFQTGLITLSLLAIFLNIFLRIFWFMCNLLLSKDNIFFHFLTITAWSRTSNHNCIGIATFLIKLGSLASIFELHSFWHPTFIDISVTALFFFQLVDHLSGNHHFVRFDVQLFSF